jgi:hypothetical protein
MSAIVNRRRNRTASELGTADSSKWQKKETYKDLISNLIDDFDGTLLLSKID